VLLGRVQINLSSMGATLGVRLETWHPSGVMADPGNAWLDPIVSDTDILDFSGVLFQFIELSLGLEGFRSGLEGCAGMVGVGVVPAGFRLAPTGPKSPILANIEGF